MDSDDDYADDDLFGYAAAGRARDEGRGAGFNNLGAVFNALTGGEAGRGMGGTLGLAGGHPAFRPPARAFSKNYRAYSTAILEIKQGRDTHGGRSNVMHGGKIIMPQEALVELTDMEMESPYTFEVRNAAPGKRDLRTHCGVLEFIADPGTVHLPAWMMTTLQLNEGDPIRLTGARLPKGRFAKVQAQSPLFLELSDPKSVLESAFRNFSCLTKGDIIEIYHNMMTFEILIMELKPEDAPGVLLLDTDLEIDFAPPKGYVEPKPQPRVPPPTMASKLNINTSSTQSVDSQGRVSGASTPVANGGTWEAFKGGGKTMGGKVVKGKGVSRKKIEEVDGESKIWRTGVAGGTGRTAKIDEQVGERKVPARLKLPFGTLFFGYNTEPFKPKDPDAAYSQPGPSAPATPFNTLKSTGNTLSGRSRLAPSPSCASATAPSVGGSEAGDGIQPFEGEGHALTGDGGGKRPSRSSKGRIVIEIDD